MGCRIQREIKLIYYLMLGILLWGCMDSSTEECQVSYFDKEKLSEIRGGDIILRLGEGFVSQTIMLMLADSVELSHCGIVVCRNDSFRVVHSMPEELSDYDGIQACSLDEFVAESVPGSVVVVRPRNISGKVMETKALYYLSYPKPFDWDFDMNDSTAFFCSEFPLHILKYQFGMDLCPLSGGYPKFSLFLDTVCFERVGSLND